MHKTKRELILKLALRSGITLTEEERARVKNCDDATSLDQWLINALTSKTTAELFA